LFCHKKTAVVVGKAIQQAFGKVFTLPTTKTVFLVVFLIPFAVGLPLNIVDVLLTIALFF